MDFGRQRGFLLDGKNPPEKVGCRVLATYKSFLEARRSSHLLNPTSWRYLAFLATGTTPVSIHICSA